MGETPSQADRKRSKWERPEALEPSFFRELSEGIRRHWRAALAVLAGLCFLLLAPRLLTRESTGDVSGKVTYGGKPIPWGRVTFVSQDGDRKAVSAAIKDGRYEVKNCPTGKVKISVESFLARRIAVPPGEQRGAAKGSKVPSPLDLPPPEAIDQRLAIPPEYGNADTSGQEYEVGRGAQTHDIDLTPR